MINKQRGQTLIETIAAIFVLVVGITAVVSMANFSLSSSSNVTKQIIGIGLARQGIEAVKNMRDTNWLRQTPINTDCHNFTNEQETASCYRYWLNNPAAYSLAPNTDNTFVLSFNPDPSDTKFIGTNDIVFWHLSAPHPLYGFALAIRSLQGVATKYFYYPATGGASSADPLSGYYRSVTITLEDSPKPYNEDGVGPVVRVISRVWWADKRCPVPSTTTYPASGSCRISLETILTNWKTN